MSQPVGLARLLHMLTWFIRRRLAAFERTFDYDMAYARELLAVDNKALFAFFRAQGMARYRKDIPPAVYAAAGLTAMIAEDCGPCTQLGVTMALQEGVPASVLASIVRGDVSAMTEDVALGVMFARAVTARSSEADALREQIVARWGKRALVSLAFAMTMSRVYPTVKYALGFGQACQRVVIGDESIIPAAAPATVVRGAA